MIAIYKYLYLVAIVMAICLFVTAIVLFSSFHICSVIKELRHSNQEEDIKALLKNSVLLNPQIQDDLPNIDGYNDLLASYFKIIKRQEKQLEEAQKRARQALEQREGQMPTYEMNMNAPKDWSGKLKYSVEEVGTETIVECYYKKFETENEKELVTGNKELETGNKELETGNKEEGNMGGTVGCREKLGE